MFARQTLSSTESLPQPEDQISKRKKHSPQLREATAMGSHNHRRPGLEFSSKTVRAARLISPSSECILSAQTTSFPAIITLDSNEKHYVNLSLLYKDQPCDVKNSH